MVSPPLWLGFFYHIFVNEMNQSSCLKQGLEVMVGVAVAKGFQSQVMSLMGLLESYFLTKGTGEEGKSLGMKKPIGKNDYLLPF